MLKWAVNGSYRQSYLPEVLPITEIKEREVVIRRRSTVNQRRSLTNAENRKVHRRKSCGNELLEHHRQFNNDDKENNVTSTPLPLSCRVGYGSRKKLNSFKDLSNISQEKILTTPENETSMKGSQKFNTLRMQYATTLPTFEVEYSPCSMVPGPILALRGVGIADSYFEKPRYLTNEFRELNQLIDATPKSKITPISNAQSNTYGHNDEESLSSSKMGDTTLERMIDAILESARKERKIPKPHVKTKQSTCPIMSPTYTAAEDPASDLNEFWDPQSEKYLQSEKKFKADNFREPKVAVNEREVRTPEYFKQISKDILSNKSEILGNQQELTCQLKRQKAVRRKRKLTISSAAFLKSSAQKIFPSSSLLRKSLDHLVDRRPLPHCPNISPDSGRNSSSDLEDSTEDTATAAYTKRRLSFSSNEEKEI